MTPVRELHGSGLYFAPFDMSVVDAALLMDALGAPLEPLDMPDELFVQCPSCYAPFHEECAATTHPASGPQGSTCFTAGLPVGAPAERFHATRVTRARVFADKIPDRRAQVGAL